MFCGCRNIGRDIEEEANWRPGRLAADDLDQALELGRAMAAEAAASRTMTTKPPRRRWRRKRMTRKARRRRFIRPGIPTIGVIRVRSGLAAGGRWIRLLVPHRFDWSGLCADRL